MAAGGSGAEAAAGDHGHRQAVSGENLGERIALGGPADELKELADTFDRMLARLDRAFASQRHFVANASHELRTPLAIMRTELDVALADRDASREELRAMGEALRETIDRCERLIGSLLTLARSEAGAGREEPVDLASLAGDCITDLRARAAEAEVRIIPDLHPAWTSGEPALLERLIANLIDNGIQRNERGGFLEVSTASGGRGRLRLFFLVVLNDVRREWLRWDEHDVVLRALSGSAGLRQVHAGPRRGRTRSLAERGPAGGGGGLGLRSLRSSPNFQTASQACAKYRARP